MLVLTEKGTFKVSSEGCLSQVRNGRKRQKGRMGKCFETRQVAWWLGGREGSLVSGVELMLFGLDS